MVAKRTEGGVPTTLSKADVKAAREALKKLKAKFEADCRPHRALILRSKLLEVEDHREPSS